MEAKNTITSSKNKLQAEINRAKSDWKVVQRSNALSGKVKIAINGEIDNYQLPMLTNYYDLLHTLSKEMEKTISDFKASVKENSESAIIDTEALNEAKGKFSTPLSDFAKLDKKIRNIYSSVAHIVPVSAPSNQFDKKMEEAKKVLTETLKSMDTFNGRKVGSIVKDKLAQQSSQMAKVEGLSYSNPKSLAIFTDKTFKNEIKEFHKIVRKEEKLDFKKEHPLLAAMNGNLTEADLQELDQLVGIDEYLKKNKKFKFVSRGGKLTRAGNELVELLELADKNVIFRTSKDAFSKESLKGIAQGSLKAMGKSASFGLSDLVKDATALVNAKGAGKIIPGLNVAADAVEVVQGISKSEKQARKDGLKGHEITVSKVGGALVDVGKVAVTTAMIGAATALLPATASIGAVVGVGIIADWTANTIDKKLGVTSEMKKGVNSLIKSARGWFS